MNEIRMVPRISFKGNEYLLIGDLVKGGAIATPAQYEFGDASFAHLNNDGVWRFGERIGCKDDLEVLGFSPLPTQSPDAWVKALFGIGWERPE